VVVDGNGDHNAWQNAPGRLASIPVEFGKPYANFLTWLALDARFHARRVAPSIIQLEPIH